MPRSDSPRAGCAQPWAAPVEQGAEAGTRIWFDALLPMPSGFDRRCTTARGALPLLRTGRVIGLSLGHVAPSSGMESLALAMVVEAMAASGALPRLAWTIHSAETEWLRAIRRTLRTAELHWWRHAAKHAETVAVTRSGRLLAYCPT